MQPESEQSPFEAAARQQRGLLREYFDLLRYHKKYWLAPIILILLAIGLFLMVGGTAVAPLIYAIF